MRLLAGSYERTIWAFRVGPAESESGTLSLHQLFSHTSHLSHVKSVAVSGPVAASASADDTIKLYDLPSSTEVATLMTYHSSTSCLSFFTPPSLSFPANLICGSEDGTVSVFDTDPFVLLKTVPVHRKPVNGLTVHSSGKLALTVGRDSRLSILNLVRGRMAFQCRLDAESTIVEFDRQCERFFMVSNSRVTVHSSEDARLMSELECGSRVLCAATTAMGVVLTGGEDRSITFWDVNIGKPAYRISDAHPARVKGVVVCEAENVVSSASSDGVIRVWDSRVVGRAKLPPLAEVKTNSRITCLSGS